MSGKKIQVLIESADKSYEKGKFDQALQSCREILEAYPRIPPDIQVSLINKIVMCLYKTEQYAKAPEEIERFEKLFKPGSISYAKLQVLKADVCIDMGDYVKALEDGKAAFEILRTTDEDETILKLQRVLGLAHFSRGNMDRARICFEDVLSACRRKGDTEGLLIAFNGLAQVHFFAGKWDQALEYWEQGLRMSKNIGRKEWTASFSLNLGMIYRKLGEWSLALEYLHSGVKASKALGHTLGIIRGEISLAFLHRLQRQWNQATRLLEKCRKLCEKEGYKREMYLCYEGLGEIAFDREDYADAGHYYSKALRIAEDSAPDGDMAGEIHRRRATLSIALNEPETALKHVDSALQIARKLGDKFEEACTHHVFALVYQRLGEHKESHKSFTHAIHLFEELDEKYERAKTLLEFGKFLGKIDKRDEGIHYLLSAKELFGRLSSNYWMGIADLDTAKIAFDKGAMDLAIVSLDKATRLLEETSAKDVLKECSKLRALVEKAMVELSLRASRHTIPDDNPENLLRFLVKRTDASRAFVVLMEDGKFDVKATHGIDADRVKRVLEILDDQEFQNPIISTNLGNDKRFSFAERNGIDSFVLIPFGLEGESGILYLDRKNPFSQKDLTLSIRFADSLALKIARIRHEELKTENLKLRQELGKRGYPEIITRDKRMLEILDLVDRVKNHPIPVLIQGETGTGKEIIARAIHHTSNRKGEFIVVNCAGIPESLLESELFGYKRGAFTGATTNRKGKFEAAHRGTIFLDEICGMSLRMQHKVLRVLELGEVMRLGETTPKKVDVRVVSATNIDLEEEVKRGNFRAELFFRLKGILIELPPLRAKKEDIPLLTDYFIKTYTGPKNVNGISPQALHILFSHNWPGNVRELKRVLETAIALSDEDSQITPSAIRISSKSTKSPADAQQILKALRENDWVKRKAARVLGMPESTLRRKLKKVGLTSPFRGA